MIPRSKIWNILDEYDVKQITIATICSHSALQIFHGAKIEGFRTLGICLENRKRVYSAFPKAKPDILIEVNAFSELLSENLQKELIEKNCIVVMHGSFIEYIGAKNILDYFRVPTYGNRISLIWESNRKMQIKWLKEAKLRTPKEYESINDAKGWVFVKLHGAKGGKGYFVAKAEELEKELKARNMSAKDVIIQEYVVGQRYYLHFFYSPIETEGLKVGSGRLELLSMDRRIETIDEIYRTLPHIIPDYMDFTVSGNIPIILRESLLAEAIGMGAKVVKASQKLFPPGIIGPFCLETSYHPDKGFTVFEISARIVAGTNLYPIGSPYTPYIFDEPMSTGRRIAREIRKAVEIGKLKEIVY